MLQIMRIPWFFCLLFTRIKAENLFNLIPLPRAYVWIKVSPVLNSTDIQVLLVYSALQSSNRKFCKQYFINNETTCLLSEKKKNNLSLQYLIWEVAWEPSCALRLKNVIHITMNVKTKLRTFPWFYRVPQLKFKQIGQDVYELWSDI